MITFKGEIYLTADEAGNHVNKAQQTVYQNWKKWGWKPFHMGTSLLFSQSDIDNWLSKNLMAGTPKNNQRIKEYAG